MTGRDFVKIKNSIYNTNVFIKIKLSIQCEYIRNVFS